MGAMQAMNNTITLANIVAQLKQVTKGPWMVEHDDEALVSFLLEGPPAGRYIAQVSYTMYGGLTKDEQIANAAFIAAAPTNIMWLIEEVGRLKVRLVEVERIVAVAKEWYLARSVCCQHLQGDCDLCSHYYEDTEGRLCDEGATLMGTLTIKLEVMEHALAAAINVRKVKP